jgi:hypothetical protein
MQHVKKGIVCFESSSLKPLSQLEPSMVVVFPEKTYIASTISLMVGFGV